MNTIAREDIEALKKKKFRVILVLGKSFSHP